MNQPDDASIVAGISDSEAGPGLPETLEGANQKRNTGDLEWPAGVEPLTD